MADQQRSRVPRRQYQATVEENLDGEFYSVTRTRTMRQEDSTPRSGPNSQPVPSNVPVDDPYQKALPNHDTVPDVDGAMEDGNAEEPGLVIGYLVKNQQLENIPATVGSDGKTLRFRGIFLESIGRVYPHAHAHIHRVGDPVESDFEVQGIILHSLRSAFDTQAIYRVTLSKCDAAKENGISWNSRNSEHGYTADEYCNLLELGSGYLSQLMMLTICRNGLNFWKIIRQIPGKAYTFQECVDMLGVPQWCCHELQGLGRKTWINGDRVPELWIGRDLSLKHVSNKIRIIMRQ